MFENVLLVFARIGKLMCTYINKCINKLKKKIFSYKFEPVYVCVFCCFCFLIRSYKRIKMVRITSYSGKPDTDTRKDSKEGQCEDSDPESFF